MDYVDVYRDSTLAHAAAARIRARLTRPRTVMEICGGQTHAIVRYGLEALTGPDLSFVHGPGCPVCVTPTALIDAAIALAERPRTLLASFGDMLRVPGSKGDLLAAKSRGGAVHAIYSPLDAVRIAAERPDTEVVLFAVGFETTAPTHAAAVLAAERAGLENFSLLSALVRVPPALEAVLAAPDRRIEGVLAAGHVCSVMGVEEYHAIAARHRVPIVVTGFEPLDILAGLEHCVEQIEAGRVEVGNRYARAVRAGGNAAARDALQRVFEPVARTWRGMGELPASGLGLRARYAGFDALRRFTLPETGAADSGECISGAILQGRRRPGDCPAFGTRCTPEHPLGAPMVSSEGACAAYYRYRDLAPA